MDVEEGGNFLGSYRNFFWRNCVFSSHTHMNAQFQARDIFFFFESLILRSGIACLICRDVHK